MSLKGSNTTTDYMNFDTATRTAMTLLKDSPKERVYGLYIIVSINTGLRVSDVLSLTWGQLRSEVFTIMETKTKKDRTIKINDSIRKALSLIDRKGDKEGFAFISQKGTVISTQRINVKLKEIFQRSCKGLKISSHSLRKTFGRRVYENNNESEKALMYLSDLFNHSSIGLTRKYLGIRQDELNSIYDNL